MAKIFTINDVAKKAKMTPATLRRKLRAMPASLRGKRQKKQRWTWNTMPVTLLRKLAA